jgi:flavin-dependent dehydrogenase
MTIVNAGFVVEKEKCIPVYKKVDAVMAGIGHGGLGAAVASARNGANTLQVERNSFNYHKSFDPETYWYLASDMVEEPVLSSWWISGR